MLHILMRRRILKEHGPLSRRVLSFLRGARLSVKLGSCQQGGVLVHKVCNNPINPESKGNYCALTSSSN